MALRLAQIPDPWNGISTATSLMTSGSHSHGAAPEKRTDCVVRSVAARLKPPRLSSDALTQTLAGKRDPKDPFSPTLANQHRARPFVSFANSTGHDRPS